MGGPHRNASSPGEGVVILQLVREPSNELKTRRAEDVRRLCKDEGSLIIGRPFDERLLPPLCLGIHFFSHPELADNASELNAAGVADCAIRVSHCVCTQE